MSMHIHHFPFFFLAITTFASHSRYFTSLMKLASSSLCTSTFATSTFSSTILQSFCFFGLAFTSLLTPTRSEVDLANMSLFLSRKLNSYACSSWIASTPMHIVLSGTLGSNGTFLNSPSASMLFLHSVEGSTPCWPGCSRRKCTFLWPGAKPFSIFLASCWLPKRNMTSKVAGIFKQRYAECKAASKVFKRPPP
jgi:hypothetical protein